MDEDHDDLAARDVRAVDVDLLALPTGPRPLLTAAQPWLFEEIAECLELPAWRGRDRCIWEKCDGHFEPVLCFIEGRVELLRCTSCGQEHLTWTADENDDEESD
jgi:hypothetical protein